MLVRMISILLVSLISLSLLSACGGMQSRNQMSKLDSALRGYGQAIRWSRYLDAHDFHYGKDGFKPKLNEDDFAGIEVTAYRLLQEGALNEEQTEADVVAEISYYNENVGTVKKIKHSQHWWYSEDFKRWFLDAAMPVFK